MWVGGGGGLYILCNGESVALISLGVLLPLACGVINVDVNILLSFERVNNESRVTGGGEGRVTTFFKPQEGCN